MITQVSGKRRALLFQGSSNKVILFLSGFPKYPSSNKFIDYFKKNNYNVLCPIYSGTFDSYGKFNILNCSEDVRAWYEYILRGEFFIGSEKNLLKISSKNVIVFSHSFGSYILDIALRRYNLEKITKAVFLSSLFMPYVHKSATSAKVAKLTEEGVERNFPISYRFENKNKFFNEVSGKLENKLTQKKLKTIIKKSLIIVGKDDNTTSPEMAKHLAREYPNSNLQIINGGHSSKIDIDKACALIDDLLNKN